MNFKPRYPPLFVNMHKRERFRVLLFKRLLKLTEAQRESQIRSKLLQNAAKKPGGWAACEPSQLNTEMCPFFLNSD